MFHFFSLFEATQRIKQKERNRKSWEIIRKCLKKEKQKQNSIIEHILKGSGT